VLAGAHLERDAAADAAASIADAPRCAHQIVDDLLAISSEPRPGDLRREAGIG
jgi:hypothetical protein